jgi:oxalate---CoA ligase
MGGVESVWDFAGSKANLSAARPAVIQPDAVSWDYQQLQYLVKDLGAKLRACGLRREDTVAVAMPDGAAGLVTQLGVMNVCGCAPLNPLLTETELRRDMVELGIRALVCDPGYDLGLQLADELGLIVVVASLRGDECVWEPHKQPTPDSQASTKHGARSTIRSNGGAAILLHTSATTGRRKIVPLTAENLKAACGNTSRSLRLSEEDRLLVMARLFHAHGIISTLSQWSAGGTVIVANGFEAADFNKLVTGLQVTWYTCGPTLHQAILTQLHKQPLPRPYALRFIRSGGNTLPAELKAALREQLGVPVLDMYGLSETGAVAANDLCDPDSAGWRSVGPEIGIMSQEGKALPDGEEGEIVVRGPSVMSEYWNDADANRGAFWGSGPGRWFRTGDLGSLDARGTLTMSGRAKEIINRGGQKIQPAEIDLVLSRHPAVKAVAAFGVPHPTLGEDVACAVVLQEGASASEAELRAFARQSLARYKVPRRVHLLAAIPLGATGKPQRLVLRERLGARPVAEPGAGAYSSERKLSRIERSIAELWAGRLRCNQIRFEDDFFHLGGDSLEAVSMLSEVEALLERALPPGATERFFEAPTLATLSAMLSAPIALEKEAAPQTERSHALRVYPLRGDGPGIEAFLLPADDEEGWYFRLLSRSMGDHRRMAMLRPENGWYAPGPDLVEAAAAQAVALIRQSRPHGPYLVGGFCLGGVIAYETARLLELAGERVVLALFDSPMPGEPHPFYAGKEYARALIERVREARRGERAWRPVAAFPLLLLRRWLWLALRKTKGRWRAVAGSALLRWLRQQAEHGYLPLYRPAPSRMPIVHFVMSDGRDVLRRRSVQAWTLKTSAETLVIPLPGSHHSLFSETNLGLMTHTIDDWVTSRLAGETAVVAFPDSKRLQTGGLPTL